MIKLMSETERDAWVAYASESAASLIRIGANRLNERVLAKNAADVADAMLVERRNRFDAASGSGWDAFAAGGIRAEVRLQSAASPIVDLGTLVTNACKIADAMAMQLTPRLA